MKRRILCLLSAIALMLAMQISVFAHNTLDWSQDGKGSISVHLAYSMETSDFGSLILFRVGDVQETDGDCAFVPTAEFAPAWDEARDLQDPSFAWDLAVYAAEQAIAFETVEVAPDGTATFEGLELGLYLVAQGEPAAGYEAISPFLIGVPNYEDGVYAYQLDACPKVAVKPLPTEPAKPTEPAPTRPQEPTLPQTGQMNWPIPLMAAVGLVLFAAGWSMTRKGRNEN